MNYTPADLQLASNILLSDAKEYARHGMESIARALTAARYLVERELTAMEEKQG